MAKGKEEEVKFEKALEELRGIVDKLEGGELELDDSLKLFERGVGLIKVCTKRLDDAQRRVEIVTKSQDGRKQAKPFREEGEEDGEGKEEILLAADDEEGDEDEPR